MKRAETCSCSLCNKFYTSLYHQIFVLDKYTNCNLVYYKHNGDDEPYGVINNAQILDSACNIGSIYLLIKTE